MSADTAWGGGYATRFRRVDPQRVEVSYRGWWPWSKPKTRELTRNPIGEWYWVDTGVQLRRTPAWVWTSLENALTERNP